MLAPWLPVSACWCTRPWILIFTFLPMRLFFSCRQLSLHPQLRPHVHILDLECSGRFPSIRSGLCAPSRLSGLASRSPRGFGGRVAHRRLGDPRKMNVTYLAVGGCPEKRGWPTL